MVALTIKNIPDKLYKLLKKQATLHRRSLNNEIIIYLERILLGEEEKHPTTLMKQARKLREKTKGLYLTQHILQSAKEDGRP